MNPLLGWALAAALVLASWQSYGWPGVAMAASAVVFWLLLQFNRALRVMKRAGDSPVGQVPNAVMFHAGLRRGMTLLQVVGKTRSLGRRAGAGEGEEGADVDIDAWAWSDAGGDTVRLRFEGGRLRDWALQRRGPVEGAAPPT